MNKNNENSYMYGILSIVCSIVGLFFFSLILSVAGIVFACIGLRRESNNKALSILGLSVCIVELLIIIFSFIVMRWINII